MQTEAINTTIEVSKEQETTQSKTFNLRLDGNRRYADGFYEWSRRDSLLSLFLHLSYLIQILVQNKFLKH